MKNIFIKIAILLAVSSIILGAFGAHGLKDILSPVQLNSFLTGIRYQMYHALAILILTMNHKFFNKNLTIALWMMVIGTIIFSFSIYLLSTQEYLSINASFLGPVTPIGGIFLSISWIILLFSTEKVK